MLLWKLLISNYFRNANTEYVVFLSLIVLPLISVGSSDNHYASTIEYPLFEELFLTTVNSKLRFLSAGQETKEG